MDAFFELLADDADGLVVHATPHARGPWDPDALHAGPPTALLAAALDRHHPDEGKLVTRVCCEVLGPVPLGVLRVRTRVLRPGRRVELLQAELAEEGGRTAMTAQVWRLATDPGADLGLGVEGAPLPGPDGLPVTTSFFRPRELPGYVEAMEVRFVQGSWGEPGAAVAWMRARVPLLDDAPDSPLTRVLVAADSGNGLSARVGEPGIGPSSTFVNVDLTVHLLRPAEGSWIGLQAETALTDHGIGLTSTVLHDLRGPIGRAAQSLVVVPAPPV